MDLWIANVTKQRQVFTYKLLEVAQHRQLTIEVGGQQRVSGLSADDVKYIIDQNAMYGFIAHDEVDRANRFHPTCYSIDKAISHNRIAYLMDHNIDRLVEDGQETRRINAVAQSQMVENALQNSNRPERVAAFDVSIQQENMDPNNAGPQMAVGTSVTNDMTRTPTGARRRG